MQQTKSSRLLLLLDSKRTRRIVNSGHLRRRRQRATQTQIPHAVVAHSGQILGDGDGHLAILLREAIRELNLVIVVDHVQVANGIVVQPDAVVLTRVLGQGVLAVGGRGTVEADVDGGAGGDGRVIRDALVDVDAGVVALAPSCYAQLVMQSTWIMRNEERTLELVKSRGAGDEGNGGNGSGDLHCGNGFSRLRMMG